MTDNFLAAAKQAGYEENGDFNGAQQDGVGRYQLMRANGLRCSAAVAYLHPIARRPNLKLITAGPATRILFDKRRAVGVEVSRDGVLEEIRADREVLLAAGGYGSPQLLMLSGIGPAEELKMFQIDVREDLTVGQNLQDHPVAGITLFTDVETLFTPLKPENVDLLQKEGRGPLTSNAAEVGGFARTRPGLPARDIQYYIVPVMFYDEGLSAPFDHAFTTGTCLLKPKSKGKVSLRSARPDAKPRIFHNYFAAREDRQSVIEGIRTSMKVAEKARRYGR